MALYPLKFKPRFIEKIWGGRKLETVLGKSLPADVYIGESWEIYDFPPGVVDRSTQWISAIVANGALAGKTLQELVGTFGDELLGDVPLSGAAGQFPLLIKFLDAREDLSVQVHPDENYAKANEGAYLKNEAWYVVQADEDARLLKGLKPGITREQFQQSTLDGTVEENIAAIRARQGDCYYLPSGTVHALGAGILVAEVQTPSDTTFRLHDFNRIEASTGKPRELHVEQAMKCIDFSAGTEKMQSRSHVASHFATVTRLVQSDYFNIEKVRFSEGVEETIPHGRPMIWMMMEGHAQVSVAGMKEPVEMTKGETLLLPAVLEKPILKTISDCVWLEVTFG